MLNKFYLASCLATRDWLHEKTLSLCAILALAGMLAPLLVLQGVKNGVIDGMRENLLKDPTVLILSPKSDAGSFSKDFIADLKQMNGASFAIGRTRDTSTDITLRSESKTLSVAMEPATEGEPVLTRWHLPIPSDGQEPEIILSAPAARFLDVQNGAVLHATLGRRTPDGRLESVEMSLHLVGILPAGVADRRMGFLPLQVLEDLEDYRDYFAVQERGFAGRQRTGDRKYASFRLYAQDLDAVEPLKDALEKKEIETSSRTREIAGIRLLESAIRQVIVIISIAVGIGFVAFAVSSTQSAAQRKKRMLGILRLLGFSRTSLMLYPVTQAFLTAVSGLMLSCGLYLLVSLGIENAFSGQGNVLICHLTGENILIAGGLVLGLSLLSAAWGAFAVASIEPSTAIREV